MTRNILPLMALALAAPACASDHDPRDLAVAIDVAPGRWPNTIDRASEARIEVAILSAPDLDATRIDPATLSAHDHARTATVPFEPEHRIEDVDGDGTDDLVATLTLDPELTEGNTRLVVTGETDEGDRVSGWDMILDGARPTLELPPLGGPNGVGVAEYDWTDPARTNQFGPMATAPRRLKVSAWYPADLGAGAQPGPAWLSHAEALAMTQVYFPAWLDFTLPEDLFEYVGSRAVAGAPLAAGGGALPIVVFSHGAGVPPPAQQVFLADLASHGFAVFAIYHTYTTGPVEWSDGQLVTDFLPLDLEDMIPLTVADQRFVLDQIEVLADSDGRFAGRLDLERIGVIGFATGGAAAAQTCVEDPRVLAGANLDGPLPPVAFELGMDQHFLLINARTRPGRGAGDPRPAFLEAVRGEAYSVTLPDAGGLNFSDYALHQSLMRAYDAELTIPDLGPIDPVLAFAISNAYLAAFLSTHVAGDPDPLLEQASPWEEAFFDRWN